MAVLPITTAQVLVGGFELADAVNQIDMGPGSVDVKDVTTFGSGGYKRSAAGLKTFRLSLTSFSDFTTGGINQAFPMTVVGSQQVVTLVPSAGVAGDTAFMSRGLIDNISPFAAKIGEAATHTLQIGADTGFASGVVLAPEAARTATGNGTAVALTGPLAGQSLYATLHVLAVAGTASPTLTVKVQSATSGAFTSPTDRVTFTAATAVGAQWAVPVAGPITDGFWRAQWTISGTTPSFTFLVAVGVL
jgi:hypothetical protein